MSKNITIEPSTTMAQVILETRYAVKDVIKNTKGPGSTIILDIPTGPHGFEVITMSAIDELQLTEQETLKAAQAALKAVAIKE